MSCGNLLWSLCIKSVLDNDALFNKLDSNLADGRPLRSFYVSQILLTPSTWTIIRSGTWPIWGFNRFFGKARFWWLWPFLCPMLWNFFSTLEKFETLTVKKSLFWVQKHHAGGRQGLNIVIRDFVDQNFTRTGLFSSFSAFFSTPKTLWKVIAKNLHQNDVVSRVWSLPK